MKAWKIPPPVEWKVTAGHGGVARRRHENLALCRKGLLVAGGHGLKGEAAMGFEFRVLKERRQ